MAAVSKPIEGMRMEKDGLEMVLLILVVSVQILYNTPPFLKKSEVGILE